MKNNEYQRFTGGGGLALFVPIVPVALFNGLKIRQKRGKGRRLGTEMAHFDAKRPETTVKIGRKR